MRIGINATFNPSGGSLPQLVNLLRHLTDLDRANEVLVWTTARNKTLLEFANQRNFKVIVASLAGISPYMRVLWEQTFLPLILRQKEIDVVFCPGNLAPFVSPAARVLWIGTIGPFWEGMYRLRLTPKERLRYHALRVLMSLSAKHSELVIFESEYTRSFFIERYGLSRHRTRVIHIGRSTIFQPKKGVEVQRVMAKYGLTTPYVLSVSHLYKYKNVIRLVEAFGKIQNQIPPNLKLALVGRIVSEEYLSEIQVAIHRNRLDGKVLIVGLVAYEELPYLYSGSEIFVFPSPCENFAYTLVEAMSCGASITCSNTTTMPEACGDAALYFDPEDVDDIADKLLTLLQDAHLRACLRQRALQHAESLPTYRQVAQQLVEIFHDTASGNK